MKPFTSVSASQIDVHMRCRRRWYFEKILGIKPPQHASAALGEELHSHNEHYVIDGSKPKKGTKSADLFYAGLGFLQPPGSVLAELVVEKYDVPDYSLAGITIRGKIDQTDLRVEDDPWIEDYKTTSSMKYALTREQLGKSPQMVMYAQFLRRYLPTIGKAEPTSIRVSHLVYLKDGNIVSRTGPVRLDREHLDTQWSRLNGIVEGMKETAVIPSVDKVQATLSSCSAFGGCPHKKYCTAFSSMSPSASTIFNDSGGASPFSGIENAGRANPAPCSTDTSFPTTDLNPEKPMDPLAALAQHKAKNAAGAAPAILTVATPAVTVPAPAVATASAVAAPQGPVKSALELLREKAVANNPNVAKAATGLLPSDAPPQVQKALVQPVVQAVVQPVVAPAVAAPLTQLHSRKPKGYMTKLTGLGYTESQIEEMGVDQMHVIIDDEIRADGTPDAPAVEAEAPVVQQQVVEETVAPVVAAPQALPKAQVPTLKVQTGLTLYIDCMPSKGHSSDAQRLEDILLPYMAQVAAGGDKGDGRAPLPHYSMIGYGQGTSRVVAMLLTNPPTGVIIADRRYPCTDAVLEVLVPMAENIVRSLR